MKKGLVITLVVIVAVLLVFGIFHRSIIQYFVESKANFNQERENRTLNEWNNTQYAQNINGSSEQNELIQICSTTFYTEDCSEDPQWEANCLKCQEAGLKKIAGKGSEYNATKKSTEELCRELLFETDCSDELEAMKQLCLQCEQAGLKLTEDEFYGAWIRENIIIGLPFSNQNVPYELMPMGETINHPKPANPKGHPGIDFFWHEKVQILSSTDGVVGDIEPNQAWGGWDIGITTGNYTIGYTEMEDYNRNLSIGMKIKKGDFIGYPMVSQGTDFRMIHWQFGYYTENHDAIIPGYRLCPMKYFDNTSRESVLKIPISSDMINAGFNEVCSGDYKESL